VVGEARLDGDRRCGPLAQAFADSLEGRWVMEAAINDVVDGGAEDVVAVAVEDQHHARSDAAEVSTAIDPAEIEVVDARRDGVQPVSPSCVAGRAFFIEERAAVGEVLDDALPAVAAVVACNLGVLVENPHQALISNEREGARRVLCGDRVAVGVEAHEGGLVDGDGDDDVSVERRLRRREELRSLLVEALPHGLQPLLSFLSGRSAPGGMMTDRCFRWMSTTCVGTFLLTALSVSGCPAESGPSPPPAPYPQATTVSPEQLAEVLPKDANGAPILLEVGGQPLTIGAPRNDAIGAAARCTDLFTTCMSKTRDRDGCVTALPRCKTAEPWSEEAACCADACVVAYEEERRLGASPREADRAVFGSTHECFPGLQDLYRADGGVPYLAPRRAPR
jgi:hypothetical protein